MVLRASPRGIRARIERFFDNSSGLAVGRATRRNRLQQMKNRQMHNLPPSLLLWIRRLEGVAGRRKRENKPTTQNEAADVRFCLEMSHGGRSRAGGVGLN
jgi:hypothetical protein